MSDNHPIRVRRSDLPYGIVPQSLIEDRRLSVTARVIAVWFCVQSSNWELRINHMRKVLSIGKDADLAARRQLKQYGYLRIRQKVKGNGVFGYLEYEFYPSPPAAAQPLADGQATAAAAVTVGGFSAAGSPAAGSTGAGQPGCLTSSRETGTREQEQPQQAKAAAQPPLGLGGGDLIFPSGLGEADRAACLQVMRAAGIDHEAQQGLLDELQGTQRAGRTVAKPVAWIRRLAGLQAGGDLVLEHAGEVAEARRARAAHLARMEGAGAEEVPAAPAPAKPPADLDAWRKRNGIPPRRTGQLCGLGGTST